MNHIASIPEVRFNLKSHADTSKPVLIMAVFRYEGQRMLYTTGEKVIPKYWNKRTGKVKESVNYPEASTINDALSKLRLLIRNQYRNNFIGKSISPADFKNELDFILGRKEKPQIDQSNNPTLYQFIEKMIADRKKNVGEKKFGQTWQKFKTVHNHLKKFADHHYGRELGYNDITIEFKNNFVEWLRSTYEKSENDISKIIRVTKQFMKESIEYHDNKIVSNAAFSHARVDVPKNYPTLHELSHLLSFKFEKEEVQQAIDLYLISAFGGGLRWSDINELSSKNEITVDNEKVLQVFTYKGRNTKSDNEVIIPIIPQLKSLLDKYDWRLPKIPYHCINELVRDGFKEAQLDRQVLVKSGIKGKKEEAKRLWEVVFFHTARYAYINFMINDLGVSPMEMTKITGQSLKVLLQYESGNKTKNALKVGDKIMARLKELQE